MKIEELLKEAGNVVIVGHVRPDGDCVGSCLAFGQYVAENFPDVKADVYLEDFSESFMFLSGAEKISHDFQTGKTYDVCVVLDASDKERLGEGIRYFETAGRTVCIDHHVTNQNYADTVIVDAKASATCELLYTLMEEEKISLKTAECLYLGIVHDTGVFKHSNTTKQTMVIAGSLIEKGVNTSRIIDDTFYRKTYVQNQILGRALMESILFMDGKCIFSILRKKLLDFYQAEPKDLDGIIDQMRITKGVECAIFLYETGEQQYKVSMRSNSIVDVSKVAAFFGGGGHVRAAGCTMQGTFYDVLNNLSAHIEQQLIASGEK